MSHNAQNNFGNGNINHYMVSYQGPPSPAQFSNNLNLKQTLVPPPSILPGFGQNSNAQLQSKWGMGAFSSLNPINYYNKRETSPMVPVKFEKI